MASFTLSGVRVFPEGTSVGAYPATGWPTPPPHSGAPVGSATSTKTVTEGKLAFTGLTANAEYFAVASVGGVYRYVKFKVAAPPEVTGVATGTLKNLIAALATAGLITDGTTES